MAVPCTDFRSGLTVEVRAQHLLADGTIASNWTPDGTRLCLGTTDGVSSAAVSDGHGGAIVVWVDNRTGDGDLYAQRFTAPGSIAAGWPADGVPLCTARGSQYRAALTSDGDGGAVVVWQDFRAGNGDLYAQRITAAGQVVWTADGLPVCVDPSEQAAPTVAADAAGGAFMAWQDRRNGRPALYLQHLTSSGAVADGFSGGGNSVAPSDSAEFNPALAGCPGGGAMLAWEDHRSGTPTIYGLKLSSDGSPAALWPAQGIVLAPRPGAQQDPVLVSDGGDGAIVVWCDRSTDRGDIIAQRVRGTGEFPWGPGGVEVCAAAGEQGAPAVVVDSLGGVIVGWEDRRARGQSDLYAQRLSAAGAVRWSPGGVPVCIAGGDQYSLALSSDGTGGAIATWSDSRGGSAASFFAARPIYHGPIPRLQSVKANPTRVELVWQSEPGDDRSYAVARQRPGGAWTELTGLRPNADGLLRLTDEHLQPGEHLEYRLKGAARDAEVILGVVPVDLPLPKPLALRYARWERGWGGIHVAYTLATSEYAKLELFDVGGRRVASRDLGNPGPGDYDAQLPSVAAGVYFVRLTQGRVERTAKAVVLR
ncbi:MAG: hypothetical protein HZC42_08705 [Candidatus Eisenbacteria bacterium]|nr:hypothetical protein [Candidatus Eisenbacteria bacterium]